MKIPDRIVIYLLVVLLAVVGWSFVRAKIRELANPFTRITGVKLKTKEVPVPDVRWKTRIVYESAEAKPVVIPRAEEDTYIDLTAKLEGEGVADKVLWWDANFCVIDAKTEVEYGCWAFRYEAEKPEPFVKVEHTTTVRPVSSLFEVGGTVGYLGSAFAEADFTWYKNRGKIGYRAYYRKYALDDEFGIGVRIRFP